MEALLAGYLFFEIPSSVALGIVEMQIQFVTADPPAAEQAG
jgi:hypothetical protein